MKSPAENAKWIENNIKEFIETSDTNSLQNDSKDKAFETPIVGFSRGDDPLYEAFKDHVGPFHLTPQEACALNFKDFNIRAETLTVISWILPHNRLTKADNRKETVYPAERWARGRKMGEEVNSKLRQNVVGMLEKAGYKALAPAMIQQFNIRISAKYEQASTWSERHAAHASGLGTFGLCGGLITPVGKAMRTGSVIAQIDIPPTPRPYTDHREYCLFFSHGTCGKCIERCPVNAITEKGKDKALCRGHLIPDTKNYVLANYGFADHSCGLCQTKVPCESKIPDKKEG